MKPFSKKIILMLCNTIMITSLSACSKDNASKPVANQAKDVKITWYLRGNYDTTSPIKSKNELLGIQELEKKTGIQIDFIDVPGGSSEQDQQLKLMLASGDYPDIIEWKPQSYPGGAAKLLKDGVIVKLNDLIDKNAPNLKKVFDANPDVKKEAQLDDSTIAAFPCINPLKSPTDLRNQASTGFVMRKDWLDKVGLNVPVSLNDWYTTLKTFKDKDPNGDGTVNEIPFDGTGVYMFELPFGIRGTFYRNPKTDKVAYGPIEPIFKDFLTEMNKWYKEGLFGGQVFTNDTKVVDSEINGDLCGSFKGLDNAWSKYLPNIQKKNPNAYLVSVPWPTGVAGKPYTERTELVTHINQELTFLTSKCKYPEEATKLIDFMYSDEGLNYTCWGVEGKSFTVENGQKKFIPELIANNELGKYISLGTSWPKYNGGDAYASLLSKDQISARDTWGKADTGLLLPAGLNFTDEESTRLNEINSDIGNYGTDMFNKFISGQEPLTNFDTYVETIKKMGIDEAMKIYQTAYDRYKAKK